jgi:hypothetical protein
VTLINTTVSGNTAFGCSHACGSGGGIFVYDNDTTLALINSTISGNTAPIGGAIAGVGVTAENTLIDGDCAGSFASNGGNLESPGDTCGLTDATDQVNVTAQALRLGPLADNGGPTETHALLPGSPAIDAIPVADCIDGAGDPVLFDQRGVPRPQGPACDIGA